MNLDDVDLLLLTPGVRDYLRGELSRIHESIGADLRLVHDMQIQVAERTGVIQVNMECARWISQFLSAG